MLKTFYALPLLALAYAGVAQAQAIDEGAAAQGSDTGLEDIVVTATRTERGVQSVPISITAHSGAELSARGITSIANLQSSVPNLTVGPGGNRGMTTNAHIYLRGVGQSSTAVTQDPNVPLYVDGVYISRPFGAVFDFLDLDRVEVLRGPQGTLFGRNSLAGAIQIISKLPDWDFGGRVKLGAGSFDRRDIEGIVNVPLSSNLSFRAAASSSRGDGNGYLVTQDRKPNEFNNLFGRAALRWQPDDQTDIVLRGELLDGSDGGGLNSLLAVNPSAPFLANYNNTYVIPLGLEPIGPDMVQDDPSKVGIGAYGDPQTVDVKGVSLDIKRSFGSIDFRSITAYRTLSTIAYTDWSAIPYPYLHSVIEQEGNQVSQEFQIAGKLLDDQLSYVAGLYFFREVASQVGTNYQLGKMVRTGPGPYDVVRVRDLTRTSTEANAFVEQTSKSYAAFLQVDYKPIEDLTLVLGARISRDEKDFISSEGNLTSFTNVRPLAGGGDSWNQFIPKVGIDYRINRSFMAYASIAKGFRSGGFNTRVVSGTVIPFVPEELVSYEAGIKTDWLDGRLRFNLGGYFYDYKNFQANVQRLIGTTIQAITTNVASVQLHGIEAETQFQVTPDLRLSAYLATSGSRFGGIVEGSPITPSTSPVNAPKFSAGANAVYGWDIAGLGRMAARVDYSYRSRVYFSMPNTKTVSQKGYSLLNARLTLTSPDERYEVAVFGTNLLDERYFYNVVSMETSYGTRTGVYAPPAQWGASLTVNF